MNKAYRFVLLLYAIELTRLRGLGLGLTVSVFGFGLGLALSGLRLDRGIVVFSVSLTISQLIGTMTMTVSQKNVHLFIF